MSILHVAFYPSDWLAGTRGLSAEETGVYITLVCRMYEMAGPIERDDNRLHRLCGTKSKRAFVQALEYLISEGKIIDGPSGLFNERAQKEIKNATEKSSKAKAAAEARWDKKPNKNNGGNNANAPRKHMPQPCQLEPEPEVKRETKVSPKKQRQSGTRLSEDWHLPKAWGDWAVSEGWGTEVIRLEADKFRDYWISKAGANATKKDWLAVWRNWMRNSDQPKLKAIEGGQGNVASKTDRLRRVVTNAAAGTSGQDWG